MLAHEDVDGPWVTDVFMGQHLRFKHHLWGCEYERIYRRGRFNRGSRVCVRFRYRDIPFDDELYRFRGGWRPPDVHRGQSGNHVRNVEAGSGQRLRSRRYVELLEGLLHLRRSYRAYE